MSTNDNNTIAQLKKQIADSTEQTKSYLSSLQESIKNYDKEHKLSETASAYMQAGIDQANWSVNELKDFGNRFQEESKDVSDELVKSARNALSNVQSSLEGLKAKASDFDSQSRKNVAQGAEHAKQNAEHAKQKIAHEAEKTKESVADGAENARSSLADLVNSARNQGSSFFDSIATSLDNLHKQVAAGASNASAAVSNAATTAKDKVAETDQSVSGGMGADLYNKTAELVNQGVEYVSSAFSSNDKPTDSKP